MSLVMTSPIRSIRDALRRWINKDCERALPEDARVMRRVRGFGLIAYVLQFFGGAVLASALGMPAIALASVFIMITTAFCLRWVGKDAGKHARLAFHGIAGLCMSGVTFASAMAGDAPPAIVLYPIPLIMAINFVLGVRAAGGWTLVSLAALAFVALTATPPPAETLDPDLWRGAVFSSRALVLVIVFSLGAVERRFEDRQTEQLEFLARHDSLTGLVNRKEFDLRLQVAIARARRHDWSLALLFVDLDNFKTINDSFGHATGDAVLEAVAEQMRGTTRQTDVAGRNGGDEFVVLLEAVGDRKSAELYGKRLLERIEGCAVQNNTQLHISASIGIAHFPQDADDGEGLVRRADAVMYEAKRLGGQRVVLTTPSETA